MNSLRRWWGQAPATVSFCLLMIAGYLVTAAQSLSLVHNLSNSSVGDNAILYLPLMNEPLGPLRALTAAFMHIGPGHLVLNLLLIFLIGREIETFYGSALFALMWITGAVGASAVTVWMDPIAATAGASGVGYALMAVFVGVMMQRGGDLRAPLVLIGANIAYTFMTPTVSLWGHLGGLIIGILSSFGLAIPNRIAKWCSVFLVLVGSIFALVWRIATFTTSGYWTSVM